MTQRKLSLWQTIKQAVFGSRPHEQSTDGDSTQPPDRPARNTGSASGKQNESSSQQIRKNRPARTDTQAVTANGQQTSDSTSDSIEYSDSLITVIGNYLDARQWQYTLYPAKDDDPNRTHHISMGMSYNGLNWGCLFKVQEHTKLLAIYGILPINIPDSHRSAAMVLITQLNYEMILGSLQMDLRDGEIRFKTAIDVEATGLNERILQFMLQNVAAMMGFANEVFSDLLSKDSLSTDLDTLLDDVRQQAFARQYFLPTEQMQ